MTGQSKLLIDSFLPNIRSLEWNDLCLYNQMDLSGKFWLLLSDCLMIISNYDMRWELREVIPDSCTVWAFEAFWLLTDILWHRYHCFPKKWLWILVIKQLIHNKKIHLNEQLSYLAWAQVLIFKQVTNGDCFKIRQKQEEVVGYDYCDFLKC